MSKLDNFLYDGWGKNADIAIKIRMALTNVLTLCAVLVSGLYIILALKDNNPTVAITHGAFIALAIGTSIFGRVKRDVTTSINLRVFYLPLYFYVSLYFSFPEVRHIYNNWLLIYPAISIFLVGYRLGLFYGIYAFIAAILFNSLVAPTYTLHFFLVYFVLFITAITQHYLRQKAIDRSNISNIKLQKKVHEFKKLEGINRSMLGRISHELRTPLSRISNIVDMLEYKTDSESEQLVDHAKISTEEALELLDKMMVSTKLNQHKITLENKSHNLEKVAKKCVSHLKRSCSKPIKVKCFIDSRLPKHLFFDKVRLIQVFDNLLNNAYKFTDAGEIKLSIKRLDKDNKRHKLLIEVRDTGIGISDYDQQHIFKAYFQNSLNDVSKQEGVGLGLDIASHIIDLFDGELQVESKLGLGSRFFFVITLKECRSNKKHSKHSK